MACVRVFECVHFVFQNTAFTAHYNAPMFYREMKERTPANFYKAVVLAFGLCATVYVIVSLAAYFEFGFDVEGASVASMRGYVFSFHSHCITRSGI